MRTLKQRFRISEHLNAGGSKAWRVQGTKRDGVRIRENFADPKDAQLRQIELEGEFHAREPEATTLRATRLTDAQLHLAERAFAKLPNDEDLLPAVEDWVKRGKQLHVAASIRIDEAVKKFNDWLDDKPDENGNGLCTLRKHSRAGLRLRVGAFANSIGNLNVNEISIETVENFLGKLNVSAVTRDNYKRSISRFFSWCIQRPRRWTVVNPCKEIRIDKGEKAPPAILTVEQCKELLKAAAPKGLAPYVSVCLFAGLRPFEAARLDWKAVNLKDREIRLESTQTKTGRSRVVSICDTLAAWLEAYENKPFLPANWRRKLDEAKEKAKLIKRETAKSENTVTKMKKGKPVTTHYYWKKVSSRGWVPDVMRHTAISHYFRKTGSYGQTAEQFGNSEAIIKNHYQGRVTSDDTEKFYALRPAKVKAKK